MTLMTKPSAADDEAATRTSRPWWRVRVQGVRPFLWFDRSSLMSDSHLARAPTLSGAIRNGHFDPFERLKFELFMT
jgi:hypothetical protein